MISVLLPVAIITALIVLNGLFVAAEFAIVGVSRAEIEQGARRGEPGARLVQWVLSDARRQDRFIATAQLGITAASLGLGMYGEHVLAEWIAAGLEGWGAGRWVAAHSVASVLSITILTYFHIVIGEMLPKSLALQHAHRSAVTIAPIMRGVQLAVYPLVVTLNGLGNALLKVVGIDRAHANVETYRTPEEIAYILRESETGGALRRQSSQVMQELLEFGDLTAAEVMVPRVRIVGIPLEAQPHVLRSILRSAPHTRYPVFQGSMDSILGVLHVRDLLRQIRDGGGLSTHRARPVPYVPETASLDEVLAAMRQGRSQLAVVMDEHGGTAGIITLEDLFEEVIGDIPELPGDTPEILIEADGRVRAAGTARVEDVGEALGQVLENEEVDTVSGLVLSLLGRPPHVGDVVVFDGVRFEVTAVNGHGVSAVIAACE